MSRIMRNSPLILPESDYEKLQQHLGDCKCAFRPSSKLLAYVLANKLMNTRPVSGVHCNDLVVGMNSQMESEFCIKTEHCMELNYVMLLPSPEPRRTPQVGQMA